MSKQGLAHFPICLWLGWSLVKGVAPTLDKRPPGRSGSVGNRQRASFLFPDSRAGKQQVVCSPHSATRSVLVYHKHVEYWDKWTCNVAEATAKRKKGEMPWTGRKGCEDRLIASNWTASCRWHIRRDEMRGCLTRMANGIVVRAEPRTSLPLLGV